MRGKRVKEMKMVARITFKKEWNIPFKHYCRMLKKEYIKHGKQGETNV